MSPRPGDSPRLCLGRSGTSALIFAPQSPAGLELDFSDVSSADWDRLLAGQISDVLDRCFPGSAADVDGALKMASLPALGSMDLSKSRSARDGASHDVAVTLDAALAGGIEHRRGQLCIVHVQDQALILPARSSDGQRSEAIHLFVGGLLPLMRRRSHAETAHSGTSSTYGDEATPELIRGSVAAASGLDVPTVYHPSAASPGTPILSPLGQRPGRLHPCQAISRRETGSLGLTVVECHVASPQLTRTMSRTSFRGWGCDQDPHAAAAKAISEGYERYVMALPPAQLVVAAAGALTSAYLHPDDVIAFSDAQVGRHSWLTKFDMATPRRWVEGARADGSSVLVLADLVHGGIPRDPNGAGLQHRANSSGVACATASADARTRALNEVLERHALLWHWYAAVPGDREAMLDEIAHTFRARCPPGFSLSLTRLRLEQVGVVLASARHQDGGVYCGLAADPDVRRGAVKAATEALVAASFDRLVVPAPIEPHAVSTAFDHTRLHRQPQWSEAVARLSGCEAGRVNDRSGNLTVPPVDCSQAVFVDLPGPDRELHVVRALVPGAIPLSFGADLDPLGLPIVQSAIDVFGGPPTLPGGTLLPHPIG